MIRSSRAVRAELRVARLLLSLAWGDTHRLIAPIVLAQDAEGVNERDAGGWGIGFSCPPPSA